VMLVGGIFLRPTGWTQVVAATSAVIDAWRKPATSTLQPRDSIVGSHEQAI